MIRPNPIQIATAKRLVAHEIAACNADHHAAAAAGSVYDKLQAHLAPLLGAAGVQALFARSAKLAQADFGCLAEVSFEDGSSKLRECMQSQDPDVAAASAAGLFATFFGLLDTFIGDRLTTQMLRRAWPTIDSAPSRGTET